MNIVKKITVFIITNLFYKDYRAILQLNDFCNSISMLTQVYKLILLKVFQVYFIDWYNLCLKVFMIINLYVSDNIDSDKLKLLLYYFFKHSQK